MNVHTGGPDIAGIARMMRDHGANRMYLKYLAANDNSKNQIYFGSSFDVLNIFPLRSEFQTETPHSAKQRAAQQPRMKAFVHFHWLDRDARLFTAPSAQLILYPQYPEVRFSGFLQGAEWRPSDLLQPDRRGREPDRVLFMGVTQDGRVLGYLAAPESPAARQALDQNLDATIGVFAPLDIHRLVQGADSLTDLLNELRRIHAAGWIQGKALESDGSLRDCNSPNCGGYTLEAELGISPNGYAEPDYFGWEIKQHGVGRLDRPTHRAVTLLTPNPDIGDYAHLTLPEFIRRYGYPDRNDRPDRYNFGGVHRCDVHQELTGLTLSLRGFNPAQPGKFAPDGAIVLATDSGEIAAGWTFSKLLQHWNRKHNQAVYVPCQGRRNGNRRYRYGNIVHLGQGTDFTLLLRVVANGSLYFDPGMKLEEPPGERPVTKSRSQFRMNSRDLGNLYFRWSERDVSQAA